MEGVSEWVEGVLFLLGPHKHLKVRNLKEFLGSHLRTETRKNFINTDVSTLDITRG